MKLILKTGEVLDVELKEGEGGSIDVTAKDEHVNPWYLVNLGTDGELGRWGYIPSNIGIQTNAKGKMVINKKFIG